MLECKIKNCMQKAPTYRTWHFYGAAYVTEEGQHGKN